MLYFILIISGRAMEGAKGAPRQCPGPIRSALGEGGLRVAGGVGAAAVCEERHGVRALPFTPPLTPRPCAVPASPVGFRLQPPPRSPGLQQMPEAAQRPPLPQGFWPDWQGDGR